MKSADVREKFLSYFESKGHRRVPSSSLVPQDDPSLLFTNAGMNQFKKVFLGQEKRDYKRAVTSQKCMRAGGKHNDLENVGQTKRHHTFFEMLGNFSFGDYFKKEAMAYAWEFVTKSLSLPKGKLYITIYEKDDEAEKLWLATDSALKGRVYRFGERDNFWSMGETGPCGPCSEIIFDQGKESSCGKPTCKVGCDCDRYLEIWNLVFMQFDRDQTGKLSPLPAPSVDTGMGLERTVAVVQGVSSNYETDLFTPIIQRIEKLSGKKYSQGDEGLSFRVISDHIRALSFCIADGAMPSNEGRGYVLRRILRRAARHGRLLDLHEPFLHKLTEQVTGILGSVYPEINTKMAHIDSIIKAEEEGFERTLDRGLELFDDVATKVSKSGKKVIPGEEVFKLYDTYGFPVDMTEVMAREKGLRTDLEGFEKELEKQRARSRQIAFTSGMPSGEEFGTPTLILGTKFVGYNRLEVDSAVREVCKSPSGQEYLVLEVTPFYAEAGGQVGDTGVIKTEESSLTVVDTQNDKGVILHRLKESDVKKSLEGTQVKAQVDRERRKKIIKNHTVTHLLHQTLRDILGEHVHQAGSLVAPDRIRFDFAHFQALDSSTLDRIEYEVNQRVWENYDVTSLNDIPLAEAKKMGAMALFGEKYGDRVRVIKIGDYSLELCGGTHVRTTGEIGLFRITQEASVASGVRRIEAVSGEEAYKLTHEERIKLIQGVNLLKTDPSSYLVKLEELLKENKTYRLQKETQEILVRNNEAKNKWNQAEQISGVKVINWEVAQPIFPTEIRQFADSFNSIPDFNSTPAVGTVWTKSGTVLTFSSAEARDKFNLNANDIFRKLAEIGGGAGGGNTRIATGGFSDQGKLKQAVNQLPFIITELSRKK